MQDNFLKKEKIEEKIIDLITLESANRLIIFKPTEKLNKVDFIIKKRAEYDELPNQKLGGHFRLNQIIGSTKKNDLTKELSVQIIDIDTIENNDIFVKDIPENSFEPDENFYFILAHFNDVLQNITENIFVIPSLYVRDVAEKIENVNENTLKIASSFSGKNQDKFSKFLMQKNHLATFLLETIENKKKNKSFKIDVSSFKVLNLQDLEKFIIEARINTFAGDAQLVSIPRLNTSKQLEYQKADYFYRDIYFTGSINFIGQEVIYKNNKVVWAMNYFGNTFDAKNEKLATLFLKETLNKLSKDCRFGKNCEFEKREFKYQGTGQGSLEKFSGSEQIFQKENLIYQLSYQGGIISK